MEIKYKPSPDCPTIVQVAVEHDGVTISATMTEGLNDFARSALRALAIYDTFSSCKARLEFEGLYFDHRPDFQLYHVMLEGVSIPFPNEYVQTIRNATVDPRIQQAISEIEYMEQVILSDSPVNIGWVNDSIARLRDILNAKTT